MNKIWPDIAHAGTRSTELAALPAPIPAAWEPLSVGGAPARVSTGFSWQYLDLLSPSGDGVVLIWARALPFVPGAMAAAREGRPWSPEATPSTCLAVYQGGRCTFYALQVLDADEVDGARWGGSTFEGKPGSMRITLDLPIPGGDRLRGEITTEGRPVRLTGFGGSPHRWNPLAVGAGRADLRCGAFSARVEGRSYHDTNASTVGLEQLGIRRWIWGRVPHPDGESVHYLLEPEAPGEAPQCHLLDIDPGGGVESRRVEAVLGPEQRGTWGVSVPGSMAIGGRRVEHARRLEDGPFYQRWQIRAQGPDGALHTGVGEVVDPTRMDRRPFGPLVRMAVHRPRGWSSPFVPLFCGPSRGRFARLLRFGAGR